MPEGSWERERRSRQARPTKPGEFEIFQVSDDSREPKLR
jgi:hypothetical protein